MCPTLVWCVYMFTCFFVETLDWQLTHKFWMSAFKYCPHQCVLYEREQEWSWSVCSTHCNLHTYAMRQAVSHWQESMQWQSFLQVSMNDKLNTHTQQGYTLLAHSLSVKLRSCLFTNSSSCSGWTNSCTVSKCGHLLCEHFNYLIATCSGLPQDDAASS